MEKVVIFTREDSFAESIRKNFDSAKFELIPCDSGFEKLDELFAVLRTNKAGSVFIDSLIGESDGALLDRLSQLSIVEIRAALQRRENVPISLLVMAGVAQFRRAEKRENLLALYFVEGPSPMLTQEVLHLGADWVWTHRLVLDSTLERVVTKLRANLSSSSEKSPPKILAVEDSWQARRRIEAALDD